MSRNIKLFTICIEEDDPIEGKALDMFRDLLKECDSFHVVTNWEGDINLVFERILDEKGD